MSPQCPGLGAQGMESIELVALETEKKNKNLK
jgi:hypothetical protein